MHAAQFTKGLESLEHGPTSRSRSASISSDSQTSRMSLLSPPPVNPSPAFVSVTAASEVVRASQAYQAVGSGPDLSSHAALGATSLLNGFLDHLLFNILGAAKSTKLARIRPAVIEVFRPHLARELMTAADTELAEYVGDLGGVGHEAELQNAEPDGSFDLTRAWKLARLRCMIYTRLGDLEEEDEDEYITQDFLEDGYALPRRFGGPATVAPTTAIFLTVIIEYIAEQALALAAQAAYARLCEQQGDANDEAEGNQTPNRLVVQDLDMEKLALNTTLGRLWRTWRKRVRTPSLLRTLSRDSIRPLPYYRRAPSLDHGKASFSQEPDPCSVPLPPSPIPEAEQEMEPQNPETAKDVETPKSTADAEFEVVAMEAVVAHKVRPRSLVVLPSSASQKSSDSGSPVDPSSPRIPKPIHHVRSKSLPDSGSKRQDPSLGLDLKKNVPASLSRSPTLEHQQKRKHLSTIWDDPSDASPHHKEFKMPGSLPGEPIMPNEEESETPTDQEEQETSDDSKAHAVSTVTESAQEQELSAITPEASEKAEEEKSLQSDSESIVRKHRSSIAAADGEQIIASVTDVSVDRDLPPSEMTPIAADSGVAQPPSENSGSDVKVRHFAEPINEEDEEQEEEVPDENRSFTPRAISDTSNKSVTPPTPNREPPWPLTEPAVNFSKAAVAAQHTRRQSSPASPPGIERAAVQRLSAQVAVSANAGRSDSPNSFAEKRAGTTGKLKGLIGRSHNESPTPGVRRSSDVSRGSLGSRDTPDEKSSLDRLIRSDETIHFTLTPKNMRDMEVCAIIPHGPQMTVLTSVITRRTRARLALQVLLPNPRRLTQLDHLHVGGFLLHPRKTRHTCRLRSNPRQSKLQNRSPSYPNASLPLLPTSGRGMPGPARDRQQTWQTSSGPQDLLTRLLKLQQLHQIRNVI